MNAHSVAEIHDGYFVCLCGAVIPVTNPSRDARSRAFWTHAKEYDQ